MTGYAQASLPGVTVTLKSVNHRFLDPRWQLPAELDAEQANLEKRLRASLRRGHVDVRIQLDPAGGGRGPALTMNWSLVETYLEAHATLSARLDLRDPPEISELLRIPGIWAAPEAASGASDSVAALLPAAFATALDELQSARLAEGEALARDISQRIEAVASAAAEIARHRPALEAAQLERLRTRMQELLAGAAINPERLLQEAALQAERGDISEELTRLDAHLAQCRALLESGGEVGKRLDFLAQELNREVNTMLSKTTSAAAPGLRIAELGLALKAEVEKIREQVQNLE
ncbi:MAG TPA: YicC/YloC family endoribonuclease [Terriglobales bacterium]|nr:YicC/YloC family endoribonuclease [Terriglobales bacterium]